MLVVMRGIGKPVAAWLARVNDRAMFACCAACASRGLKSAPMKKVYVVNLSSFLMSSIPQSASIVSWMRRMFSAV
jgi:hypothetical protein